MNIYLKNQKDSLEFCVAKCPNEDAVAEVIKELFDVLRVNECQYLLILKEAQSDRRFFINCFQSEQDAISHMQSIIDVRTDEKNDE